MTAARVAAIIARAGETVTLRRLTGTNPIPFDVKAKASIRRGDTAVETVGASNAFTHDVTISNAEIEAAQWPGPPVEGDLVIRDGQKLVVLNVTTLKIGDVVARHNLACKA